MQPRIPRLVVILVLGCSAAAVGQEKIPVEKFMQAKLVHSQELLQGLVTEDYEAIVKHAQSMTLLSQDASWRVLQTPEYMERSREFRRATQALMRAGQAKNLDGATLAYVDVTLRCVDCHKYVRKMMRPNKSKVSLFRKSLGPPR